MSKDGASSPLLLLMLIGIVAGALLGGAWPAAGNSIAFIGDLFIRALLMLVVPLIVASMIVGISRIGDVRRLGGLGGKTLAYYMLTTGLSVFIGILLVLIISPGRADTEQETDGSRCTLTELVFTFAFVISTICPIAICLSPQHIERYMNHRLRIPIPALRRNPKNLFPSLLR